MDDFDDERFSRGVLLPAPAARHARHARHAGPEVEGEGPRRVAGGREEQQLGPPGRPSALRVRGLCPEEAGRIRDELQLLAALEVAGLAAVPAVLEIEDDGYVRETAPAQRHRGGRRAAVTVSPPTGERLALARAREALDALIESLHTRGWVLGAPLGEGLGSRSDGSVIVLDLGGLRREDSLAARQDDRRWVDSVLQDHDRTLRRRVHVEGARAEGGSFALGVEAEPGEGIGLGGERLLGGEPVVGRPPHGLPARAAAVIREVLRQRHLRRTAVLSGLTVLLCGAVVVLGTWWAGDREVAAVTGDSPSVGPVTDAAPVPSPAIEDPWMLAADLAGARHAFVTGVSEVPASAPGSESLAEDQRLRAAYEGITVHEGGPVVHSAELVDGSAVGEELVLRAVTSMEEHELEASHGAITSVPASEPVTVLLTLRWDGSGWLIVSAEETALGAGTGED